MTTQPDLGIQRIEARTAVAMEVPRGAVLRVIDIDVGQVADLVAFARSDPMEHFSQNCRRVNNWTMPLSVGDCLYSNRNEVMFTVVADAVGVHDMLFRRVAGTFTAPCSTVLPRTGATSCLPLRWRRTESPATSSRTRSTSS